MESNTNSQAVRHGPGLRTQLNSASGLPFEKVLSSEQVASAIESQGIEYRERFFLPI